MRWYIVIKTIKGHRYRYRQRTWREGEHVRTESVYLGRADGIDRRARARHGIGKGDIVRAVNKQSGQVVEREVRSIKDNALALVEPTSGIPFKYSDDQWSFEVIKKARRVRPLQFKIGDRFIDKRDGEVMTLKKRWPDKGRYFLEGTSGADATMTEVQLLEGFTPISISDLENELRSLYARVGPGLMAGEALPAKPSPDDILDFGEEDKSFAERLAKWQQDVDALKRQSKIRKAFEQVRAALEVSEAGYRYGTGEGIDAEYHGAPSTFPDWVEEKWRRKKLFERLLPTLYAEKVSYPTRKSASRQRALYHLILDRVDYLAGIDTAAIREKIMRAYGQSQSDRR